MPNINYVQYYADGESTYRRQFPQGSPQSHPFEGTTRIANPSIFFISSMMACSWDSEAI